MSEFRFCLEAAALHDEDSSALADAIERYVGAGMPAHRAQLAAIADVIADVHAEREQLHAAVREQHTAPAQEAALAANPFRTFLMRQGVALRLAADFAPGTRERLAMGRTFRRDGLELDQLAQRAAEQGFLRDPDDIDGMYQLIARAAAGERIAPLFGADGEAELAARVERQRQMDQDSGRTLGLTPEELADTGFPQADPDVQARVRLIIAKAEMAGVDAESILADAARIAENGTDHDFLRAAETALDAAVSEQGAAGPRDRSAGAGQEGAEAARADQGQAGAAGAASADVGPAFRRGEHGAEHRAAAVQEQVSRLTRDWLRKPDIHVVGSVDDLPQPLRQPFEQQNSRGARGALDGVYWRGGVYLVADALHTPADVQRVLFHESLGHYGLRSVFGASLDRVLTEVAGTMPKELARKAEHYGLDLADPQQRGMAAEELLAELAETRPELGVVRRAVAAIRTWLRAHGIDSLRLTQDEVIANFILPARDFVERGREPSPESPARGSESASFSRKDDKPFYSALARGVEGIPAKAQGGDGWRAQIEGLVNKGMVKRDEVEWSGLNEWLRAQTGKVSKQEVLDYLEHNGVQVQEVMHQGLTEESARDLAFHDQNVRFAEEKLARAVMEAGGHIEKAGAPQVDVANALLALRQDRPGDDSPALEKAYALLQKGAPEGYDLNTINDARDELETAKGYHQLAKERARPVTQYGSYTLPGGENYRELLLTLPQRDPVSADKEFRAYQDELRAKYGSDDAIMRKAEPAEMKRLNDLGAPIRDSRDPAKQYRSGHWDAPNVLAHIRLNDRTDADGKKVLFVEELQSDWAQEGRKKGFGAKESWQVLDENGQMLANQPTEEAARRIAEQYRAGQTPVQQQTGAPGATATVQRVEGFVSGPPRGPFVDSTDKWLPLALKRIVKLAADEGYDRVAFISGAQSADRYDLSKQISRVRFEDNHALGVGKAQLDGPHEGGLFTAYDLGGKKVVDRYVQDAGRDLPDLIGKDAAAKLLQSSGRSERTGGGNESRVKELSGLDLKVGGEGMRAFYDKIVPAAANKVLAKLGGGKVGEVAITADKEGWHITPPEQTASGKWMVKSSDYNSKGQHFDTEQEAKAALAQKQEKLQQPGFDITPAMRERTAEGVPMFSRKAATDEERTAKLADRVGAGYHAYAGVEQPARQSTGSIGDSIAKALVPAGRKDATLTAGIIRANLGEQAREREVAQQRLMEFAKRFDRMPVAENYKFIDAMERGIPLKDPEQARAAAALRRVLDERRDQVIALGKGNLENFNENYFPHIWKDKATASNFFTRRPLEGGKGFLKQRTYDFFSDGLKAGLEPVTTNPVELAMLKAREMDRYIYGQRIFGEMKEAGIAKFVAFGAKAPDGWVKINDKIARVMQYSEAEKGMILRGEYYAPEQAATLINNHLSPGLAGIAAFDVVRKAGNIMNAVQLGLSAFHLGFTTLDAMISKAALGLKQASRGNVVKGAANVLQALNPAQPFMNLYKGDRLLKAYLGNLNDPSLAPIVEALTQGGGRVKMDDIYRNAAANEFRQAIRKGNYGGAAMKVLPRMLDLINKPIFEYLVPRQKLGVFFDMAKDALEREPGMDLARKREVMGKLWDSVDNRMGELVYDNVFWNRALKDALQVSVRSVGWNLGTFREIGGGVKDLKDIPKLKGLSDRTAYIFGLTFVTAMIGMLTQYLYTGEGPRELKDVFFPRTGQTRPDGTEDRLSLPSYMKDIYEYAHDLRNFGKYGEDPFHTLENKLHPLVSTMSQMLTNKDFFGGAIRSPGDSSGIGQVLSGKVPTKATDWQQELDEAHYLLKQMSPFSLRNYQQQAKLKGEEPSIAGYLSSPSMIGITPAPGYITKDDAQAESSQVNKMRESLVTKFREEMRDGADWGEIRQRALDAGIRGQDLEYIRRSAVQRPPKRLKEFGAH